MQYTAEQVFSALRKVIHPELDQDIVSLGMVQTLEIEGNKISFALVFNKENTTNIANLKKQCVKVLETELSNDINIRGNIKAITKQEETQSPNYFIRNVKNIIAVASGKGGVGKSTVSTQLAVTLAKQGYKVGLVDADIFGPSMPKMFGLEGALPEVKKINNADIVVPIEKYGVKVLSIGFFVDSNSALVWRGPMAGNALKQMLLQTDWGELDYLFIDLPPGTSDIHLTLVQTVGVTGAIIVSTPQNVALADVVKGINMFTGETVNVPVLGLIENMAWFTPAELPNNKYYIFGKDGCKNLSDELQIPFLGQIPIVQSICESSDTGEPLLIHNIPMVVESIEKVTDEFVKVLKKRNEEKQITKKVEIDHNKKGCSI